jgi:hypothetical protein
VTDSEQQQDLLGRMLQKAGGRASTLLNTGEAFFSMADGSGVYDEGELPSSEVEFRDWMQVRGGGRGARGEGYGSASAAAAAAAAAALARGQPEARAQRLAGSAPASHTHPSHPRAQAQLEEGASDAMRMINFNFAWPYYPDLGLYVAVDGAANIARSLPAAALISTMPPGSFYSVRLGWAGVG